MSRPSKGGFFDYIRDIFQVRRCSEDRSYLCQEISTPSVLC